jgi:cGMP-dependent protein kinase
MPPEIVLNRGHDFAADLWPIGVLIFELMSGAPPFYSADSMSTYNRIIVGMSEVAFPAFFNEHAVGIIKALCRDIGSERLGNLHNGFAGIWAHPWFRGFDWKALRGGTMVPPVIPVNKIQKYPTTADGALNESRYTAAVVGSCPWDEEF